jgi:hypothetical protein
VSSLLRSPRVRATLSSLFQVVQGGLGLSVTPEHFYFPIPSLKSFRDKDWRACRPCAGFDFRLPEQVQRLQSELQPFIDECAFPEHGSYRDGEFHFNNGFFERVDAEVAYAFVRRRKPRRIVEVGSGNSTLVMATAVRRNAEEGFYTEFTAVEPLPAPFLKNGVPGLTQLIPEKVQDAPLSLFRALTANDILFIDSSHVVSIDSDVVHECLRILPELAPGVLVHFHDIFAPFEYPEKFVKTNLCFWGEQYMLEAFLSFNRSFKVMWSGSAMQHFHPDLLREAVPAWEGSFDRMPTSLRCFAPTLDGKNVWPCSFWIERVA